MDKNSEDFRTEVPGYGTVHYVPVHREERPVTAVVPVTVKKHGKYTSVQRLINNNIYNRYLYLAKN
jgi:hypothetical protein